MDGNNISHDQIAASSNLKGMLKTDNAVAFLKMHVTLKIESSRTKLNKTYNFSSHISLGVL
jgi:hypothetical protein